jgi:YHS domain-containing protein
MMMFGVGLGLLLFVGIIVTIVILLTTDAEKKLLMATTVVDPVCWMDVDIKVVAGKSEYRGQSYYFCSLGCKNAFDKEPAEFIEENDEYINISWSFAKEMSSL